MKKLTTIFLFFTLISVIVSCKEEIINPPIIIIDGVNFIPETPDADEELTIVFKAAPTSALYGYTGDVYAHIGVVTEGTWFFVPAGWTENIEKCKMTADGENVWKLQLSPTIRQWFNSGETAVNKIGVVIRSADSSKKGVNEDTFVTVTDSKFTGFKPAAIKTGTLPTGLKEGINIINNTTVTLVLADKDKNGGRKDFAHVVGDFNDWKLSNTDNSQMFRDDAAGCWWITLSNLDATKEYAFQYYMGTNAGETLRLTDPYSKKILDPNNDKYISSSTYNQSLIYPQGAVGLVSVFKIQQDTYNWQVTNFVMPPKENMVIYELLLRDFTPSGNINGALQRLDYLKELGVTAIELMPIQEFDGNNSWGYNPTHYFAPDKAYGTPEMYKLFIDECHKRGMAVILDMVFNQATGNCPFVKIYWDSSKNRPLPNNPWMNETAPHPYSVFEDFNHSYSGTRNYFKQVLKYWITEFKIDGYRMDLTKGLTQTPSSESTASNYDQTRIDILTDYYNAAKETKSDVLFILEHFCANNEETELANKGMYLWRNVNHAYSQAAMGWNDSGGYADFSGMFYTPNRWVGFAESHDEERNFNKAKLYGNGIIKSDSIARINRVPLVIAFNVLTQGPKMIWEFGELGYDYSINDFGGRTNPKPSAFGWLSLTHRKNAYDKSAKIINLKKNYPNAFISGVYTKNIGQYDWTNGKRLILAHNELNLVVLGNFLPSGSISMTADFPNTGTWYDLFSGESISVTNTKMSFEVTGGDVRIFTDRQ